MNDELDKRRKRLLFRCQHMGTAENDIVFGGFARANVNNLSEEQVSRLEGVLQENDNDLFNWVSGVKEPPQHLDHDVMSMLRNFRLKTAKQQPT